MISRHRLVLEPTVDGHAMEWLWHLVAHLDARDTPAHVTFLVAAEIGAALNAGVPSSLADRVHVQALRPWEQRLCTHRSLTVSAFARWWMMRRYLRHTGADSGHFLSLDHLSLPLAIGLRLSGRPVDGILFRPSVHYRSLGRYQPSAGERMRDFRKGILYRRMLSNRSLRRALTLDPYFPTFATEHYRDGAKVQALPDPVHPLVPHDAAEAALADRVPSGRLVFVLFGVLAERKGVLALLDALAVLKPGAAARIAIVLAGQVAPAIAEAVRQRCHRLAERRPELWLHVENRRLTDGELEILVARADVVLAPYQRFVGSSGVLLWAAQAGRPVLAQEFGLLGRLVREHRLGLTVDTSDRLALATAIGRMVDNGAERFIDRAAARAFVAERSPQRFAAMVLEDAAAVD